MIEEMIISSLQHCKKLTSGSRRFLLQLCADLTAVICGVVWYGVVWYGAVWCGVVWCGVVWCAEGAVTRRQWPGCLPTGTGKREGCVSKCALCASVLLYSRDQCTVALGPCCSADACARSHRVYSAHCTVCAALHYPYFVCGAALLGAMHCTVLCVPCCIALVGSGQWKRRNALSFCLLAGGSGTPAAVRRTACRQWAVGGATPAMHCLTAWGKWAIELLQCTASLPRGSG